MPSRATGGHPASGGLGAAEGGEALARAAAEIAARLDRRGVLLSGAEAAEELVDLLDAVERFEQVAERAGADLMVDEPLAGAGAPIAPDDAAFVLPRRRGGEAVADFIGRIADAAVRAARVGRGVRSSVRER